MNQQQFAAKTVIDSQFSLKMECEKYEEEARAAVTTGQQPRLQ